MVPEPEAPVHTSVALPPPPRSLMPTTLQMGTLGPTQHLPTHLATATPSSLGAPHTLLTHTPRHQWIFPERAAGGLSNGRVSSICMSRAPATQPSTAPQP